MRRHLAVPLLALGLSAVLVAGCSSSTQPKKTLTQVVTVTGSSPTGSGGAVTVISPVSPTTTASGDVTNSAGTTGSTGSAGPTGTGASSASPSATPTTSGSTTSSSSTTTAATTPTGKIVKIDPLKADCSALLDANDVKKVLGVSISSSVAKIKDVGNPDIGRTGLIRCRYGAGSAATSAPVSVALANYTTAAQAKAQLKKTADSLDGTASSTNVQGYPATVIISDGGLLLMNYDTWTLSLAIADKLVPDTKLPDGLTQLATMVLLRLLKTG